MPKSYDFPSLGDMACFEAAARHLSFKKAAAELNVTPAAVSHRIRALEIELAQALFYRQHRGVELTEVGTILFVALQRGFDTIAECISRVRAFTDHTGVTIASTTAMSSLWLTKRLSGFVTQNPDITISQIVQDGDFPPGPDLSIVYGDPSQESDETVPLFASTIVALGTKKFASQYGICVVEDLAQSSLIHTQAPNQNWTGWSEWFSHLGVTSTVTQGHFMNNHLIALQAAESHLGAVLGWEALVRDRMHDGGLIQLVPETMQAPHEFYLRIHAGASEHTRLVAKYLAQAA